MGIKIIHRSGTDQELEMLREPLTGLLLQDPGGQVQQTDMGGTDLAADADNIQVKSSYGIPFIIECTIDCEETGGAATDVLTAAGDSDVFPAYDSSATVLTTGAPFKFKMIDAVVVTLSETTKAADTILIQQVATNGTTQADWTDAMTLNLDDHVIVRPATLNQDSCVIDVGENIRFDVVLADSTNHAVSLKVYIFCMRTVSEE